MNLTTTGWTIYDPDGTLPLVTVDMVGGEMPYRVAAAGRDNGLVGSRFFTTFAEATTAALALAVLVQEVRAATRPLQAAKDALFTWAARAAVE